MTRGAVMEGFERFADEMIEAAYREFDVVRAVAGDLPTGPGAAVVNRAIKESDAVERRIVRPELERYRESIHRQFAAVLEYAAGEEGIEAFADEILAGNTYYRALDPALPAERHDALRELFLDQQRRLGDAAAPLVASPEGEFWAAVEREFDREEALALVDEHFRFTDPLRDHPDAFRFETEVDLGDALDAGPLVPDPPTLTVEYTDEALRTMIRAEEAVVADAVREVRRRFGD